MPLAVCFIVCVPIHTNAAAARNAAAAPANFGRAGLKINPIYHFYWRGDIDKLYYPHSGQIIFSRSATVIIGASERAKCFSATPRERRKKKWWASAEPFLIFQTRRKHSARVDYSMKKNGANKII